MPKSGSRVHALMLTILIAGGVLMPLRGMAANFPTSGQFDQVTTIVAPRVKLTYVQSISFKGNNIRVDKTDLNQLIPLTQIETPDTVYLYSSAAGNGEKSPVTRALPPLLVRMDADTKAKLKMATKTGTDTFDGYKCDLYKTTEAGGGIQVEFWVSTDPNFPFTLKTVATDKTLNKVTTVNLENIGLNVNLDDSLFEVPHNIKIVAATPASSGGSSTTPPAGNTTSKP
jgi:hypothetical protein